MFNICTWRRINLSVRILKNNIYPGSLCQSAKVSGLPRRGVWRPVPILALSSPIRRIIRIQIHYHISSYGRCWKSILSSKFSSRFIDFDWHSLISNLFPNVSYPKLLSRIDNLNLWSPHLTRGCLNLQQTGIIRNFLLLGSLGPTRYEWDIWPLCRLALLLCMAAASLYSGRRGKNNLSWGVNRIIANNKG